MAVRLPVAASVALLSACASPAPVEARRAEALTAVRQTTLVEPPYENKPRYLAIALGEPVHRVVWCVVDGITLYVDRDGDGRLRPERERFTPKVEQVSGHFIAKSHTYDTGGLPAVAGSPAYPRLTFELRTWNLDYQAPEDLTEVMAMLRANPEVRNPLVTLRRTDAPEQFAMTEFAATRGEATVLHFDASETWGLVENLQPQRLLVGQDHDLQIAIGTPGLGPWSFAITKSESRSDPRHRTTTSNSGRRVRRWARWGTWTC